MLNGGNFNGSLRERTLTGVRWSGISQVLNQGFTFIISVVLARILGPKVYGLIGMILVFSEFATVFGDLGLAAAIIQRKNLEPRHLNAVFWTNIAVGSAMTLMMVSLAPLVARFYHEPALLTLTAVIALKYLFDSLCVVQLALLSREMRFGTLAGIRIGSTLVSGLAGLGFALQGMGPWSLVAQTLGASLICVAISWKVGNWRPMFTFDRKACKELFGFGGPVLGFNIVNYWARTLDNLLIGRFIGPTALGIYGRAYAMMLVPLNQVSQVIGRVMFPALSTIQDDKPRVKRAYLKSIGIISLITFPMMIGAFAVSDHIILALLGEDWAGVIPLFKIFCWVGLLQSIGTTMGWIYQSQGRTGLYFVIGLTGAAVYAVAFIVSIRWGIMGVAWAYFVANLILWYPTWLIPFRLIGIEFWEVLKSLSPAFFCALSVGVTVWGVGSILPAGMSHWKYLAVQVPLGVVLYGCAAWIWRFDSWQEGRRAISEMIVGQPSNR